MPASQSAIDIYQLKVTLQRISPPIWRRVLVPATMTLGELHDTIQHAMGWEDNHLHEFEIDGRRYGVPAWDEMGDMLDEDKVKLGELKPTVGYRFIYTYDFGDYWQHLVEVEAISSYESGTFYPVCVKAKRACPPEDVGGVWGYEEFLEAVADENHEDHADMLEWVGGDFDPEQVDLAEINEWLDDEFYGRRWTMRKLDV